MDKNNEVHTALRQHVETLAYAASGTPVGAQATTRPTPPASGLGLALHNALR